MAGHAVSAEQPNSEQGRFRQAGQLQACAQATEHRPAYVHRARAGRRPVDVRGMQHAQNGQTASEQMPRR
ncbi:unnamed protein product [Victoria cruziana]